VIAIVIVYILFLFGSSQRAAFGWDMGIGLAWMALLGPESGIFLYRIVGLYPGHGDRERGLWLEEVKEYISVKNIDRSAQFLT
jgi:hypothetical protein